MRVLKLCQNFNRKDQTYIKFSFSSESHSCLTSAISFNICGTGLKLFHLNTRSLLPKIDEIRSFSCLLKQEASIFGFNETHLSPDILN